MFETILGLPAHPLLVHAGVVFGPLLVLAVLVYGLVPALRARIEWAVVGLAVVAPLALWAARLSGDAFRERMVAKGIGGDFLAAIDVHREFGEKAAFTGTVLGVLALLLVYIRHSTSAFAESKIFWYVLVALSVVTALVTAYYVFKAGDTGAHVVWNGQ